MKIFKQVLLVTGFGIPLLSVHAQTFQNLNFEQAEPVIVSGSIYYPYGVTAASALPDWTVTIGGVQQTQITENDPATGSTWVSLVGPGGGFGFTPIDGNYSVLLQGGGTASSASISQTGLIPVGTESLFFEAQPSFGSLDLLLGNQIVPFTAVGSGPNYTLYGANISAWAGDTEPLTFSTPEYSGNWEIDDISFSTTPIPTPEPSIFGLAAIGGLIFAARRWLAR